MATHHIGNKTACRRWQLVASLLIKLLLEKGYAVNTTVRDPADLTDELSFDAPIAGCELVFHIATPNPRVHNVMKACVRAKTVKRVILTSSAAAVTINKLNGTGLVMDESNWTDVEFLSTEKPPTWLHEIAEENNIDLITVIPTLMAGPSLTSDIPAVLAMSSLINGMKGMQMLSGSISVTHMGRCLPGPYILAEKESASGRYTCSITNSSVPGACNFLNKRYPQYKVPTDFGDFPSKAKLTLSSEKLIKEGFSFKYGIEEIYDQAVEYFKTKGLLQN
ncbi:anthocyanidin reductase ((2S)-flavan-3-ol-forming) [Fagus crenata]